MKAKKLLAWGMAITLAFGTAAPTAPVQAAVQESVAAEQLADENSAEVVTADETDLQDLSVIGSAAILSSKRPATPSGLKGILFSKKYGKYVQINNNQIPIDGVEYALYNPNGRKFLTKKVSAKNLKTDKGTKKYIFIPLVKKKLKKGSFYKVVVRTYVMDGSKRINSKWSAPTYIAGDALNVKITASGKEMKTFISWKAVKGATSYTIYQSTSEKSFGKKLVTTTNTSYVAPTNSTDYFYRIVPNKKVGKKTYKATTEKYYYFPNKK